MRWWLNTDHKAFGVDNASVKGLDFSALDPLIWMVQWQDGHGEIEHQVDKDTNDNGLRENFIDVIPYAPFFQQFLERCPRLTLTQAKKIDVDLIRQIFESKRQAPFHYPIAAGDYWWDATDETLMSSTVGAIQNATASLNNVIAQLNAIVAHYNSNFLSVINGNASIGNVLVAQINSTIVNGVNTAVVNGVNTAIVGGVNGLVNEINANIVGPHNNALATYNAMGDALVAFINGMLGSYAGGGLTINYGLTRTTAEPYAQGFSSADIAHSSQSWANPYSAAGVSYIGGISGIGAVGPGTFNTVTAAPYAPIAAVAVATTQWVPIGSTTPVTVTPAEQAGILNGITARTNALNLKKNIKIGQVNALTTIPAVIAYDVTTGW